MERIRRMSDETNRFTILVPSNDQYSDLWQPLLHYLDSYWSWRSETTLLGANYEIADFPSAKSCPVGSSAFWGEHVLKLLDIVKTETVLLIMPDYFLTKQVDQVQFDHYLDLFEREHLDCLALTPRSINSRRPIIYGDCKEVDLSGPYCVTLEIALWKTSALRGVLRQEDSPWSLERSTRISAEDPKKWCFATQSVFHYKSTGALIRGQWTRRSKRMLTRDGLESCLERRAILTRCSSIVYGLKGFTFRATAMLWPTLIHRYNSHVIQANDQTKSRR